MSSSSDPYGLQRLAKENGHVSQELEKARASLFL